VSCGLRDVLSFEVNDKPAVLVTTAAFGTPAARQAAALGQPEVGRVLLAHPVADRTDEEMHELARGAVEEILSALR
jgi:hypothetical protein